MNPPFGIFLILSLISQTQSCQTMHAVRVQGGGGGGGGGVSKLWTKPITKSVYAKTNISTRVRGLSVGLS